MKTDPKYPIYIISKGRWESRLTSKALETANVPYRIVVEPHQQEQYADVIDSKKILTLPFDNLGQGSIPARNWVWDHSIGEGHERHWILDDIIRSFRRYHGNMKVKTTNGVAFRVLEDLVDRYENVPMAGMEYNAFMPRTLKRKPLRFNTRIYSCILLDNKIKHRWRGRYNEDTDLSIRILKDGYCTILIHAFLCEKSATMTMKGGNTDELYRQDKKMDGRWLMAESLRKQHPDITKIVWKWGRWQHKVDYSAFKKNKLIRKSDVVIPDGPNNYGMKLKVIKSDNGR